MRRRDAIRLLGSAAAAAGAAAWMPAAQAQDKVRRIGIIVEQMRTPPYDGLLQGLRALGYVAGRDHDIEWRFANGRFTRVPEFVDDFAKNKVDVIFLGASTMADLVRQATHGIPIVLGYSVDPVGAGLVASLKHPGGNITGMASSGEDATPRRLKLLTALVPGLKRLGLLRNPESSSYDEALARAQSAARAAGVSIAPADAREPADVEAAFTEFRRNGIEAVMLAADGSFFFERRRIGELALAHRLPLVSPQREFVVAGGLMSCGEDLTDFYRRAASFVDRILKGAKPGDLPMEQPARFHVALNTRTAAALGLAVPRELLAEADEVIE